MENVELNLSEVLKKIEISAEKTNKELEDITIIAVTKTISLEKIEKFIYNSNIINLGENKVKELIYKEETLEKNLLWHMIGHLQKNKVKYVIDKVKLIHSVDSLKLAQEINKCAKEKNIVMDILIQINIGNEPTKYGLPIENVKQFIIEISPLTNICVKGLMTVAPHVEKADNNRHLFRKMYELFIDIKNEFDDNIQMEHLSMGMTNDYEVAIEEGSNMIRIGTGIFGNRL